MQSSIPNAAASPSEERLPFLFSLIFRNHTCTLPESFNNEPSFRRLLSENRLREVHNKMFTGLTNLKTLWVETFMPAHKTAFIPPCICIYIAIYNKLSLETWFSQEPARECHNLRYARLVRRIDAYTHHVSITTPHPRLDFFPWNAKIRSSLSFSNVKSFIEFPSRNNIANFIGIYRNWL